MPNHKKKKRLDLRQEIDAQKINSVEAFRIAHEWAVAQNLPWFPSFDIGWKNGRWHIRTNSSELENGITFEICSETGAILTAIWNPGG